MQTEGRAEGEVGAGSSMVEVEVLVELRYTQRVSVVVVAFQCMEAWEATDTVRGKMVVMGLLIW